MPSLALDLDKGHTQQVLVNIEDGRHNLGNGEVLLHERVIQVEAALDEHTVVVPIIPQVELAIEWQTFLVMLFLFERK